MLIKYNKSNIHALAEHDGASVKKVHWLQPGWNEFPNKVFALYKNDPEILDMIDNGVIELMDEKVKVGRKVETVGVSDAELDIRKLEEKKAVEVIKGTLNLKMLQRWADEETRHKVKRAVEAQLKPLLPENRASS